MEIDSVFLDIGESGRQQVKYGLMLCLVKMYHPLHTLQFNFVGRQTEFSCNVGAGVSLNSSCLEARLASCTSLTYREDTIIAEWDLVCDMNWYGKATMSSLMLGKFSKIYHCFFVKSFLYQDFFLGLCSLAG